MVSYDLPASFQYVHDQTGQKLHYVGHSLVNIFKLLLYLFQDFFLKSNGDIEFGNSFQGTLIALAAFSQNQLLSMSRSAVLLSPIAYVGQMTSPLARNAADNFIAEVKTYSLSFMFDFQQNKIL